MTGILQQTRRCAAFACLLIAIISEVHGWRDASAEAIEDSERLAGSFLIALIVASFITSIILWRPGIDFVPDIVPTSRIRKISWLIALGLILVVPLSYYVSYENLSSPMEQRVVSLRIVFQFAAALAWYNWLAFFYGPQIINPNVLKFIRAPLACFRLTRKFFDKADN